MLLFFVSVINFPSSNSPTSSCLNQTLTVSGDFTQTLTVGNYGLTSSYTIANMTSKNITQDVDSKSINENRIRFYLNIFLFVILLLGGIIFYKNGVYKIQRNVRSIIENEISDIVELYQKEYDKLKDIISNGNVNSRNKELNNVSNALKNIEILRKQKLQLLGYDTNFSLITIIKYLSILVPTLVSFYEYFKIFFK